MGWVHIPGLGWQDADYQPRHAADVIGPTSQNGFPANDPSLIVTMTAPGTSVRFPVRRGVCGQLLVWAAGRWHREVEPLVVPGCWGYAARDIRGSTEVSNHASGTAIDLNAPKHPLGTDPTSNFTPTQIAAIHRLVTATQGALRWGGAYQGRNAGKPLEINAPEARVAQVLAQLTAQPAPAVPQEDDVAFQSGSWPAGTGVRQTLPCPVGPNFAHHSGYLSLGVGWADATDVQVVFVGGRHGDGTRAYLGGVGPLTLPYDDRRPLAIPSGTELISLVYTSANPVGWSLELFT